ncbi:hypothetical protein VJ786_12945 [Sphingobacterium sp. PU5-4]|uniref:Uncharacterized protein n=1 Tax=Sphingobacterium tenebrionis TaxID=3111775 RepID=A0ABU8I7W8_9SPHI
MKRFIYVLLGISLLQFSCKQDELFVPVDENGNPVEQIGIVKKLSGLTVKGDYDLKINVAWPTDLDQQIKEILISFMDEGEKKEFTVSDFSKPYIFEVSKFQEYTISFYAVNASGISSNALVTQVTPKKSYNEDLLDNITAKVGPNIVQTTIPNLLSKTLELNYSYQDLENKTVTGKLTIDEVNERFLIKGLNADDPKVKFSIVSADGTDEKTLTINTKPILFESAESKQGWTIYANAANTSTSAGKLDLAFDGKVFEKTSANYGFISASYPKSTSTREIYMTFTKTRMEPTDSRYVNEELKSPAGPYDNIIPLNLHIYLIGGNNVGASEVFLDPLNTVQVFGIKNNGEMVELALKDIPKNEILPLLNYKVSIPLEQLGDLQVYKGLKVQFNNKTTAQMGVHEFVLEGYIYE